MKLFKRRSSIHLIEVQFWSYKSKLAKVNRKMPIDHHQRIQTSSFPNLNLLSKTNIFQSNTITIAEKKMFYTLTSTKEILLVHLSKKQLRVRKNNLNMNMNINIFKIMMIMFLRSSSHNSNNMNNKWSMNCLNKNNNKSH